VKPAGDTPGECRAACGLALQLTSPSPHARQRRACRRRHRSIEFRSVRACPGKKEIPAKRIDFVGDGESRSVHHGRPLSMRGASIKALLGEESGANVVCVKPSGDCFYECVSLCFAAAGIRVEEVVGVESDDGDDGCQALRCSIARGVDRGGTQDPALSLSPFLRHFYRDAFRTSLTK